MEAAGVTVNRVRETEPFFARVRHIADQFFQDYPVVPRELYERILAEGGIDTATTNK
jgi:hypothetical protein